MFIQHIAGSVALLVAAALPIPGIKWLAGAEPKQELGLWFACGVVGPLLLTAIMAVYSYLRAGAKIYAEQQARIASLEEEQTASATFPKRPIRDVKVGEAVAYLITNSWGSILCGPNHYTSLQGLLGIVRSKVARASEVHYLNDAE